MNEILIIDDEVSSLNLIQKILKDQCDKVVKCQDAKKVMAMCKKSLPLLVILDLHMPGIKGEEVLEELLSSWPSLPIIIVTGDDDDLLAESCLKRGAFDFLTKPISSLRLKSSVRKALDFQADQNRLEVIQDQFVKYQKVSSEFDKIITEDYKMKRLFQYTEVLARTDRDILITGETGTGKDLFANAIHELSGRKGEFVAVNVAGLDDNHFSDTLFGHTKGSFTGATQKRDGLIEKAKQGTLFLDEIGDLSISSQVKLLRLLQEREYLPIGSDEHIRTDARFIVATSRPLLEMMDEDKFRKDLYFRLRAQKIEIPPLRDRSGDIKILWKHFSQKSAIQLNCKEPVISEEAIEKITQYDFLGNVRELEALVFQSISLFKHYIGVPEIKQVLGNVDPAEIKNEFVSEDVIFPDPLPFVDDVIDKLIVTALRKADGNQSAAAKLIGMSRRGLISRIRRHHLDE